MSNNPLDSVKLPDLSLPSDFSLSVFKLPDVSVPSLDGLVQNVVATLDKSFEALKESFQTLLSALQSALESANLPTEVLQEFASKLESAFSSFVASHPELQPLYNSIQEQIQKVSLDNVPTSVVIAVSAVISYSIISSLLSLGQDAAPSQPYPNGKYNATSARAYFDSHPLDVIARGIQVATKSLGFGISLLQDYAKYVFQSWSYVCSVIACVHVLMSCLFSQQCLGGECRTTCCGTIQVVDGARTILYQDWSVSEYSN